MAALLTNQACFTRSYSTGRVGAARMQTTTPRPSLKIRETRADGWLRLSLTGDLDLASAPVLDDRLARFRAVKAPVRLDLSKLDFIDSTGIHLLVRTLGEARLKKWELHIERDVSPEVMRLFRLVHLDHFVWTGSA
jgi:anti-anti-sigma factor